MTDQPLDNQDFSAILGGMADDETKPPTEEPQLLEPTRPHFSFSQLNMWMRCSMQYYFRYILGLKERPSLRLANGKAGHTAVEINAIRKMKTEADMPLEEMLDRFSTAFDGETVDLEPGDLNPGEDVGKQKDETANTLRYFRAKIAPHARPIAVEQEFTLVIPQTEEHEEPLKPIIGRIDLIQNRTEDHPLAIPKSETIDNKFVGRMYSQGQADLSPQLNLYDMTMSHAGINVDNLGFQLFLPPTKKEGPRVVPLLRSKEFMRPDIRKARHHRLIHQLRTVAKEIRLGLWKPTDNPITCATCGFYDRCQYSLVKSDFDAMAIRQKNGENR